MEFSILLESTLCQVLKRKHLTTKKHKKISQKFTNCYNVDGEWCHGKRTGKSKGSELDILIHLLGVIAIKCIY